MLLGGDAVAVQRARPVLAAYADPISVTGKLGTALDMKLINKLLFAANAQLLATAVQLGHQLGIDSANLLEALSVCSGAGNALSYARRIGSLDAFAAVAGPFLQKDITACLSAAEAHADLGLLQLVVENGPLSLGAQGPDR
ncbi:MAG: binding domain of 6-phosphogluconate dehydrogenase family protein [Mycobacterium sp.]|nr:binding domain of 6-phosphogluconate dehydrogenase family protein [Mycobacterium sp.]